MLKDSKLKKSNPSNYATSDKSESSYLTKNLEAVSLGIAIRKLRLKQNISQGEAALASDISQSYLSHLENGTNSISFSKLHALSKGVNLPLEDFMKAFKEEYDVLLAQQMENE